MKSRNLAVLGILASVSLMWGCEEEEPPAPPQAEEPAPEAAPAPRVESPPTLAVTESGPEVRGSSVVLELSTGVIAKERQAKLGQYLSEESKFLSGKDVRIVVDRKAKPSWVATFLTELQKLKPSQVTLATETRSSFPGELTFIPMQALEKPAACSLVGTITEDRGTAIWRLKGGTARKRGRGMGGPDLTMTGDTIQSMAKSCDSDLFFVTGSDGVEWGLVYDLAAAGVALEGAGLSRAVIAPQSATAGRALDL